MRQTQYVEGNEARENFEEGMKALFSVPKGEVVKAEKKAKKKRVPAPPQRKPKAGGPSFVCCRFHHDRGCPILAFLARVGTPDLHALGV
jgi:hypothetical protein